MYMSVYGLYLHLVCLSRDGEPPGSIGTLSFEQIRGYVQILEDKVSLVCV